MRNRIGPVPRDIDDDFMAPQPEFRVLAHGDLIRASCWDRSPDGRLFTVAGAAEDKGEDSAEAVASAKLAGRPLAFAIWASGEFQTAEGIVAAPSGSGRLVVLQAYDLVQIEGVFYMAKTSQHVSGPCPIEFLGPVLR